MWRRRQDPDRAAPEAALGTILAVVLAILALTGPAPARAAAATSAEPMRVIVGYLGQEEVPRQPLSFLEPELRDEGVQGARLGITDNNTTGRFLNQRFELVEVVIPRSTDPTAAVAAQMQALADKGVRLLVADLPAERLVQALDQPAARGMLVLNARTPDDSLRNEACRPNLLHTMPSRRMLADALAQYLVWKRWTRWMLVAGRYPEDEAYAEALRRAAKKFGAKIVEQKSWTFEEGNRRADSGHTTVQSLVPTMTQGADHDVLVVADERDIFGEYLPFRTAEPRPVAGTQGLVPTNWSRVHEQWGATQLHSRFEKQAGRWMTPRDHAAWVAVRAVGEAATRTRSADPEQLSRFITGPDFTLAAFKGQALSFRPWDGQLRQPVLLAGPRMLVSVSPQDGFLHRVTTLDTLGDDQSDSRCTRQ